MDISVRHLKILFSFYGLDLEEEVLEVTIAYGVRISATTSIRSMHGLRCLLVKCCKKGLHVIREVNLPTGRIRMFLIWNKSVKSKDRILVGILRLCIHFWISLFYELRENCKFTGTFMRRT